MKKLLIVLMVMVLALVVVACTNNEPAKTTAPASSAAASAAPAATTAQLTLGKPEILLGYSATMTGVNAQSGEPATRALDLKVKQINAKGGIYNSKIKTVSYDDKGEAESAVKVMTRLVTVDKVDVVMASLMSTCVLASGQIVEDAKIPTVTGGTSAAYLLKGWKYLFRCFANATTSFPSLTKIIVQNGATKAAMLSSQDEFCKNNAIAVNDAAPKNGLTIAVHEVCAPADKDWTGQFAKMLAAKPGAVILLLNSEVNGPAVKQIRSMGYKGYLYGGSDFGLKAARDVAGSAMDGCIFLSPYYIPDSVNEASQPKMKQFMQDYMTEYGHIPPYDSACRFYDSITVLEKAITDAKSLDGTKVRDAIKATKGFEVLAGTLDFTAFENGESQPMGQIFIIHQGKIMRYDDFAKNFSADTYKQVW